MFCLLIYLKSWKILLAFPLYLLAFFSYLGTNIILPLFTCIIIYYCWIFNNKLHTKYYLLFLFMSLLVLVLYIVHLPNDIGGGRISELLNPQSSLISDSVNWERRESINTPFMNLFINKYENSAKIFVNGYLNAFSPTYLFSKGE